MAGFISDTQRGFAILRASSIPIKELPTVFTRIIAIIPGGKRRGKCCRN